MVNGFFYNGLNLYFGKPEGDSVDLDFGENGLKYFDLAVEAAPIKNELKAYDYKADKALTAETPTSIKTNELGDIVLGKSQDDIFKEKPTVNIQMDVEQSELDEIAEAAGNYLSR